MPLSVRRCISNSNGFCVMPYSNLDGDLNWLVRRKIKHVPAHKLNVIRLMEIEYKMMIEKKSMCLQNETKGETKTRWYVLCVAHKMYWLDLDNIIKITMQSTILSYFSLFYALFGHCLPYMYRVSLPLHTKSLSMNILLTTTMMMTS